MLSVKPFITCTWLLKSHTNRALSFPFLRQIQVRRDERERAGENWINASRQLGGCKPEIKIAFRVVCHPALPRSAGGKLITWRCRGRAGGYVDCRGPQSRQTGKGHDGFPFPYMRSGGRVRGGGTAMRPRGSESQGVWRWVPISHTLTRIHSDICLMLHLK